MSKDCKDKNKRISSARAEVEDNGYQDPENTKQLTTNLQQLKRNSTKKRPYDRQRNTRLTIDRQDQQARDKTGSNDEEKYNTKLVPDYALKIKVKVDGNPAIALVDNQTISGDLISTQYCNTYNIASYALKKPVQIYLALKGSKGTAKRFCRVKLEWEGHSEN